MVFEGGVGETGVFGKSTFERTRFGVKLHQEGHAPYLMRRCQLLFSSYPNLRVTYTPAPSAFYESVGGMTLKQMRGLLWEYAAILYYK